ncbi:MAG: DUF433 domain-containing protein [Cyanobacteria bacterium P01_F01_bin.143]
MNRISVDSQIHFGKPCITGTRITVQSVLELLNEGLSFEEILRDYYSDLEIEDIQACLQYAIALISAEEINLVSAIHY